MDVLKSFEHRPTRGALVDKYSYKCYHIGSTFTLIEYGRESEIIPIAAFPTLLNLQQMKPKIPAAKIDISSETLRTILGNEDDPWVYANPHIETWIFDLYMLNLQEESGEHENAAKTAKILDELPQFKGWRKLDLLHLNLRG